MIFFFFSVLQEPLDSQITDRYKSKGKDFKLANYSRLNKQAERTEERMREAEDLR